MRADNEIRQLSRYLSNIIDSMPSLLIGIDPEKRVTLWKSEAVKRTGISPEDAAGKPLFDLFPYLRKVDEKIEMALQTKLIQKESRRKRATGEKAVYEDIAVFPLVTEGRGEAVVRVDDVTEYVNLEEAIAQSEKMLSIGGLAAGMAHEINNPLGGMIQTCQVILRRLSDSDLKANAKAADESGVTISAIQDYMQKRNIIDMLRRINDSGKRASTIVHNMLSFASMDQTGPSSQNLPELVD